LIFFIKKAEIYSQYRTFPQSQEVLQRKRNTASPNNGVALLVMETTAATA
jgi:hypothetical protein